MKFFAAGGYSSFCTCVKKTDFRSDFFPAAMALHNGQGCSPSKVFETASVTDWLQRLFASIVVQAMVCSVAQCKPVAKTSARTTRNFPQRANTTAKLNRDSETASADKFGGHSPRRIIFQQSKPACRSAADRTKKSNPHRPDECNRATPVYQW